MDPDGNLWPYIISIFILVFTGAFFTISEIAIVSLNDNKIRKMAQDGHKKAILLVQMIDKPSRFLATIRVGITLSGFLASALAADAFSSRIIYAMRDTGVPPDILRMLSIALTTLLLSFIMLVFGEMIPKRAGMENYEKISFLVARPLRVLSALEGPFVLLLSASANLVLRMMGLDPESQPEQITEEEIRMMIDVGEESGHIEQSDKDMINNIFEFDDRTAEEIMSHRTEITAVEADDPLEEIIAVALKTGYSRIPVYKDSLDAIVGILYVKDLLEMVLKTPGELGGFNLRERMREPLYVLESTSCKTLLTQFKEKKVQMAIVVDEYGGTAGLITMEDLLESIVGNIQDEYDDEEEDIQAAGENQYILDGLASFDKVAKLFSLDIPDGDEFDTIGGYVVNRLGQIPSEDEQPSVKVGDVIFTVREMDDRRVSKIEAERVTATYPANAGTHKEVFN